MSDEFEPEFDALLEDVQTELLALTRLLQQFGPHLGRPRVDTLNASRHANMKELRFSAVGGEWRVAFAFDPKRKGILLVAGDKWHCQNHLRKQFVAAWQHVRPG